VRQPVLDAGGDGRLHQLSACGSSSLEHGAGHEPIRRRHRSPPIPCSGRAPPPRPALHRSPAAGLAGPHPRTGAAGRRAPRSRAEARSTPGQQLPTTAPTSPSVTPACPGSAAGARVSPTACLLTNHSRRTVTIYRLLGEPYARGPGQRHGEQNVRSPAFYLKRLYATRHRPADRQPNAPPSGSWSIAPANSNAHRTMDVSHGDPGGQDKAKRHPHLHWQVPSKSGAPQRGGRGAAVLDTRESKARAVIVIGALIVTRASCSVVFRATGAAPARRSRTGRRGTRGTGGSPGKHGDGVIAFLALAPLACLMHWYVLMLYVFPSLRSRLGWWSAKRRAAQGTRRRPHAAA